MVSLLYKISCGVFIKKQIEYVVSYKENIVRILRNQGSFLCENLYAPIKWRGKYTITSEGVDTLKEWILSPSEPSEIKKPFLVQLAWSKQLNRSELNMLLDGYENSGIAGYILQKFINYDVYNVNASIKQSK